MSREVWVRPWRLRWRGWRQWHRVALGPLCVSFYFYRPSEHRRPAVAHSWRYVTTDGDGMHASTFDRWFLAWDRPGGSLGHRTARWFSRAADRFDRWPTVQRHLRRTSLRMTMREVRPNEWLPRHERPIDGPAAESSR